MKHPLPAAIAIATSVLGHSAAAAVVSWSGSAGDRAAEVQFRTINATLEVTLTNTSSADAQRPTDILTAVLFNIFGSQVSLIPESAILASGSIVLFGGSDPGGVVGGEWAYASDPLHDFSNGISSSGLGSFGPHGLFPGSNLQGPESPGGVEYGITSAGDDPATGNTPVTGTNALIKNSVVFRLGGLPAAFDLARIDAVRFQYGTDFSEPHVEGQLPGSGSLALFILSGAIVTRRRR